MIFYEKNSLTFLFRRFIIRHMKKIVTRQRALEAATKVLPDLVSLVPRNISEVNFIEIASEEAFVCNLQGDHIDVLRAALKILKETGVLI